MMAFLRRVGSVWLCLIVATGLLLGDASAFVPRLDDDGYDYEYDDDDGGAFIAADEWDDDDGEASIVAGDWDDEGNDAALPEDGWENDDDDGGIAYLPEEDNLDNAVLPAQPIVLLQDDDDDDDGCDIIDDDADPVTDGYCALQAIVRLQPGANIEQVVNDYDLEVIADIAGWPVFLLGLPPGANEPQTRDTLTADSRVAWAELNRVDQAPEGRPQRFFLRGQPPERGAMNQAYAPVLIGIPNPGACGSGAGVRIAVIDSGIDPSHPAFQSSDLRQAWNAFSNQDGLGNVDDIGNDEDDDGDGLIDEMTGHGTHVTGIITQIAPQAAIIPIKALDSDGVGQAFYLARAISYAVNQNAEIINLSLGSTANARVVSETVGEAAGAGVFVAAAAGNNGAPDPLEYPGAQAGVFAVAATDRQDRRAKFTSYHQSVALSAPGVDIVSPFALDQPPGDKLGSDYALWSGTSMATPFVSGTAALLLAQNPARGAGEIAALLRGAAAPIAGDASGMGSGRLDAGTALGCGDGSGPGDAPPSPTVTNPSGEQQATSNLDADADKDNKKDNKKKKKKGKNKGKKGKKNRR